MTPAGPDRAKPILATVLKLPSGQRETFLREACGENSGLREEVEALLFADERNGEPGEAPTATSPGWPPSAPVRENLRLKPGEKLGDRFVVVQFLASGGMGEVYEVIDEHLQGKHFALKTLRPEIAADTEIRHRFEREVLIAQEVNHRNVCPTHDLRRLKGPRGEVVCLTMKLLRGESLAARLRRLGPMPPEAALPMVRQMAAGLDAAHAAKVIHRDFKPGNVMIEYQGEETHVWLTDFGVSRIYDSDLTHGQIGQIAGTRGYLAPELFQGRTASPASDVYSFGVVLQEMLADRQPGLKAGVGVSYVQGIPEIWDRVIAGCLENDPAKRFQSAGEAIRALEQPVTKSRVRIAIRGRKHLVFATKIAAAAVFAAAVAYGVANLNRWRNPLPPKRHVAVISLHRPEEPGAVALIDHILESVTRRLVRSEALVHDLLILGPADFATQQKFTRPEDAMNALGANLVLAVSLEKHGSGRRLNMQVLDLASKRPLRQGHVEFDSGEAGKLPEKAAEKAASLLEVTPRAEKSNLDELASLPPAAYQLFTLAEEFRRQPNDSGLDQAIEKYEQTLETAPHFATGFAQLALAHIRRYGIERDSAALTVAERNVRIALDLSPDSPRAVLAQALIYLYSGRPTQALEWLNRSLRIDPGNPEVLIYQARAYHDLNRPLDEENTYRRIILERPSFWLAHNELGLFLYRHGRYQDSAEALREAAQSAPRLALPLTNLGTAYLLLGRRAEAQTAFKASLERSPSSGAYLNLGNILFEDGDYKKALTAYEHGRDLDPSRDLMWRNIGDCWFVLGDRRRMRENYSTAAKLLADHLKTNPRNGSGWMTLGFYQSKLNLGTEAAADIQRAEEAGATDVQSQFIKAQALAVLGRKGDAIATLVSCLEKGLAKMEVDLALDLQGIRNDPEFQKTIASRQIKPVR